MRTVEASVGTWALHSPFVITGYTITEVEVLYVRVREGGASGHGEASGVYYSGEDGASMLAQVEAVSESLKQGIDREALRQLMPSGGARNAIDCALWDLECKLKNKSIWDLTGVPAGSVTTVNTVGIDTPANMGALAKQLASPVIKVKLNGEQSIERITAVRQARPDAIIVVDVNQGWSFDQLVEYVPRFKELEIAMIEQPLPRGADEALEDYDSPVTLCADESCLDCSEFEQAARRYQMINIKLDKTGGLTEALELASMTKEKGLGLMVGNMVGTSLAMAPGYVVAQLCQFADLDGPLFLTEDRPHALQYTDGMVTAPNRELWG